MRVAVIDLGTNTFNLLIAEAENNRIKTLYNKQIAVKLGQGGIGNNTIAPEAYQRGINAIAQHKMSIDQFGASKVLAFGTSAIRTANNGEQFTKQIREQFGIEVQTISGDHEAELIYYGVRHSLPPINEKYLILDIGGGSNEFIIADHERYYWKQSFKLGMARIIDKFELSNPVTNDEIETLSRYFESELTPLFEAVSTYKPTILAGAEGSFETFYNLLAQTLGQAQTGQSSSTSYPITLPEFQQLYRLLTCSTTAERMNMKGMEPYRVEMIVPAAIFVNFIVQKLNIQTIWASFYSLKEGAAWNTFFKNA